MTVMGNRGSRNNRNQGKRNGTQRSSRRNSGLNAVRIDWENVTFDQETGQEEETEEDYLALSRRKGLELITPGDNGSSSNRGRRKSARPPRLSGEAEVDFIENELEGSSGFELREEWADRYFSLGERLTAMELERQKIARMEEEREQEAAEKAKEETLQEEQQYSIKEARQEFAEEAGQPSIKEAREEASEAGQPSIEEASPYSPKEENLSVQEAETVFSKEEIPAGEEPEEEKLTDDSQTEEENILQYPQAEEESIHLDPQTDQKGQEQFPESKEGDEEEALDGEEALDEEEALDQGDLSLEEAPEEEQAEDTSAKQQDDEQTGENWEAEEAEETDLQENFEEGREEESQEEKASAAGPERRRKSARPQQYSYVQIPEEEYILPEGSGKAKKKHGRLTALVGAVAATVAIAFYGGMTYYYSNHFFHGTTIDGLDCSEKTAYEVEQMLADSLKDYAIEVSSRDNQAQRIYGNDIGYRYLSGGEILDLVRKQKPYEWISGFLTKRSYTAAKKVTFDKTLLQTQLKALDCAKEENQVEPQNAFVTMKNNAFEIVPETQGSELRVKEAYRVLDEAVSSGKESVDFTSEPEVYVEAELTHDSPAILSMLDAYNNYARASITYTFGNERVTLDGDTLKTWLEFDEKGQLLTDSSRFMAHIQDYVAGLAAEHDTVGTSRAFTAYDGRTVYVYSYAYGWMIDQEEECARLQQDITSGATVSREPVYAMTAASYGENDLGDTYIEVDLTDQHMYYYRDGYIIFDSDIVSGDITVPGRATPEGIYTLYFKQSPAVLRGAIQESTGLPEYETQVTYWMPFNGGIGFHDAEWQPYFGGDRFVGGGSHGCINLPYYAAAELYNIIEYDVPIVCFY